MLCYEHLAVVFAIVFALLAVFSIIIVLSRLHMAINEDSVTHFRSYAFFNLFKLFSWEIGVDIGKQRHVQGRAQRKRIFTQHLKCKCRRRTGQPKPGNNVCRSDVDR